MAAIVEVWTAPFVATTGEVIASSDANAGYRGNLLWIRQFMPANPGSSGLVVSSTGVNSGAWATVASLISSNQITEAMLNVGNSPTDSQVMTYESTAGGMLWSFILAKHITDANVTTAKIANDAVTEPKLAVGNSPSDSQVMTYESTAGGMTWSAILTKHITSGNITAATIASEAVTEPKLDADNAPTDTYLLSYVAGTGRMRWVAAPSGTGGIPSGLVGMFQTAAALAAATGWSAYSGLAGRIMVGVGTVDGQTFSQGTDYGTTWAHGHTTSASGSGSGTGTGATATGSTGTGTSGVAAGGTAYDEDETGNGQNTRNDQHTHSVPSLSIPSLGVTVSSVTVSSVTTTGTAASTTYLPPMHALVPGIKT